MTENPQSTQSGILGPFVGSVTNSSVKIWLGLSPESSLKQPTVTLHESTSASDAIQSGQIVLSDTFSTGTVTFESLKPDSLYYYRLWHDETLSTSVNLQGLTPEDLYFRTLPEHGFDKQLDFLLMSCHNPDTAKNDGFEGFAVWHQIPEIMSQNKNVRFAILTGDQIYGDEVEAAALQQTDPLKRNDLYLGVYRKFWDNVHYRRVLCSLPAVLMWDDHDITDGWGSREDSFTDKQSDLFKPEWVELFKTAQAAFAAMQASRNPDPVSPLAFDTCFRVGRAGFVVADLRSNRNVRKSRIWLPEQRQAIENWITANRAEIDTLFFVSSVVFSHGSPQIERGILKYWFYVLDAAGWLSRGRLFRRYSELFTAKVGDLRDDINDSWGSDVNQEEADKVLDFLFGLQNPPPDAKPINVVILSGDIHTPGYSTIYSADPNHAQKAVIPHIVSTPVAYEPFSWIGEAIFRHLTKVVPLGKKGFYTSQVSHHFCYRNVVVVSLRNYEAHESYVKVKYYLEGFPEPQIMFFDLIHSSRREAISWTQPRAIQPVP